MAPFSASALSSSVSSNASAEQTAERVLSREGCSCKVLTSPEVEKDAWLHEEDKKEGNKESKGRDRKTLELFYDFKNI